VGHIFTTGLYRQNAPRNNRNLFLVFTTCETKKTEWNLAVQKFQNIGLRTPFLQVGEWQFLRQLLYQATNSLVVFLSRPGCLEFTLPHEQITRSRWLKLNSEFWSQNVNKLSYCPVSSKMRTIPLHAHACHCMKLLYIAVYEKMEMPGQI
jgi:hypothetical protein